MTGCFSRRKEDPVVACQSLKDRLQNVSELCYRASGPPLSALPTSSPTFMPQHLPHPFPLLDGYVGTAVQVSLSPFPPMKKNLFAPPEPIFLSLSRSYGTHSPLSERRPPLRSITSPSHMQSVSLAMRLHMQSTPRDAHPRHQSGAGPVLPRMNSSWRDERRPLIK